MMYIVTTNQLCAKRLRYPNQFIAPWNIVK